MRRWLRSRLDVARGSRDEGQLVLLILAYTVIAALLVTVVVDVSRVFLDRRSLVAAADGAALSAANQPDLDVVYAGAGEALPLSPTGTRAAVRQYAVDADLPTTFDGFRVIDVETDGITVTVTFGAQVQLPLLNRITDRWSGGYRLQAVARARSPLTP